MGLTEKLAAKGMAKVKERREAEIDPTFLDYFLAFPEATIVGKGQISGNKQKAAARADLLPDTFFSKSDVYIGTFWGIGTNLGWALGGREVSAFYENIAGGVSSLTGVPSDDLVFYGFIGMGAFGVAWNIIREIYMRNTGEPIRSITPLSLAKDGVATMLIDTYHVLPEASQEMLSNVHDKIKAARLEATMKRKVGFAMVHESASDRIEAVKDWTKGAYAGSLLEIMLEPAMNEVGGIPPWLHKN